MEDRKEMHDKMTPSEDDAHTFKDLGVRNICLILVSYAHLFKQK